MSRASGRKNLPRAPQVSPDTPEGRDIGESARQDPAGSPIPGLTGNIANYETVRRAVPVGEPLDEFRGMMAHGVPHEEHPTEERAQMEREGSLAQHRPHKPPEPAKGAPRPPAIPVYLVEEGGGPATFRTSSPRHITVPASTGADPVRVCGRNLDRVRIGLLNEDTSNNIRFAQRPSDLVNGGGALLPWPANSYQWFHTQDELYALSAGSGTPLLSIVEEFEQEL
jgi:hypothetical protein